MISLTVVARDGKERSIEATEGSTLMQALRDNGFDELVAICAGCCSCATCHVHIDQDSFDQLVPPDEDESELVEMADDRAATSRLSCQVVLDPSLDGMRVIIARED